jgi:hypothetical protein
VAVVVPEVMLSDHVDPVAIGCVARGGLAAGFHVGGWTREHDDIDPVALEGSRCTHRGFEALGFS